ncbi:MAG: CHASE2 domain-containing protein, partial [Elusimicrobia bacterium]|nr:CHASE2 domain-containing protein [Elusimicrobiota bacterium]
ISQIRVGSLTLPTDGAGRLWLRYSPPAAVRSVPAWEVLAGDAPRGAFAGKIVFVGSSAQRLQDLRATPLSPVTPGVEIQAQIAEQALSGGFLRRPDWADGVEIVYTLALGALLILLLPRLGAAWCGALGLSVAAAAFPLSWYAYARLHWLLDPLFPFLSALAIYIVSSWLGYLGAERQRNRLAILDAVKDELVSTVSHDLRGPVNSMIMLTEALRLGHYGPLNEKQDRNLKMIENQGRRLVAFVANVLDAAKIKAGRLELHKQPVRPQEMIPTAVELFSLTASAKGVTLQQQVAADVPAVLADREKLEQVINNLITNAMKFTPSGGRITVAAAREGSFARFSVSDTGLGIRAEDLPKLFRPFGQVDVARQKERKITGTGLGLSICKSLVEAHGGSIAVESLGEGRGTTFHFTIPAA